MRKVEGERWKAKGGRPKHSTGKIGLPNAHWTDGKQLGEKIVFRNRYSINQKN